MAQKQERSMETEQALMRAVMRLCTTKNAAHITVREICAEAGVSVGAFYHHFETRQDLFRRIYESFDHKLSKRMEQISHTKSPQDVLSDILLFHVYFLTNQYADLLSHCFIAILNDPERAVVNPDRVYYRTVRACVQQMADKGLLRPEYSPNMVSELCISFVRGWLLDWTLHDCKYDLPSRVRTTLPILISGFLADCPPIE